MYSHISHKMDAAKQAKTRLSKRANFPQKRTVKNAVIRNSTETIKKRPHGSVRANEQMNHLMTV